MVSSGKLERQAAQKKKKVPTDDGTPDNQDTNASEAPSEPVDGSADPVRESSSGGQARSSTVPSSSLANTLTQPNTAAALVRAQTFQPSPPLGDKSEGPAEGPCQAQAGAPATNPAEASANESTKDPGKDCGRAQAPASNKRVDWGGWAYESGHTDLMKRPGFGSIGEATKLKLNSHYVNLVRPKGNEKDQVFHQYTVSLLNSTIRPYYTLPACADADYFTYRSMLAMETKNAGLLRLCWNRKGLGICFPGTA